MTIIRAVHSKDNPYVVLNKTCATDNRLSWKAKGIYFYAFSRPDDWQFYQNDLIKQSTDGRESVRSGLKELEENGYLHRYQNRANGRYGNAEYVFFETPVTPEELKKLIPQTENPPTDVKASANPPLLNKEEELSKEDNNREHEIPEPEPDPSPPAAPSAVVVSPSLEGVPLRGSFAQKISKEYEEEKIAQAVDAVRAMKNVDSWERALTTALREEWEAPKPKENLIESNRDWAQRWLSQFEHRMINGFYVILERTCVRVAGSGCSKVVETFEYASGAFRDMITKKINMLLAPTNGLQQPNAANLG